jgi:thioredoxin reductase (NADPH)
MKIFKWGKNTGEEISAQGAAESSAEEKEAEKNEEAEPYDLVIIGGGPAGYSAAIYAARYNLKTIMLAREPGGMIAEAPLVENYPGIESISGMALMEKFQKHAEKFGIQTKYVDVRDVKQGITLFSITDSEESAYKTKTVLFATGTEKRHLDVTNEKAYLGKGISYCATCDAAFYKDKIVAVVGGNDTAAKYALKLSEFASKIFIVYRNDHIRAEPMLLSAIKNSDKIEVLTNDTMLTIRGEGKVEGVLLKSGKELVVDGIFVAIGGVPNSHLAEKMGAALDEQGYIKTNQFQETSIPKVFAAGDVTNFRMKQVITAAAQGAVAAEAAYSALKEKSQE